MGKHDSNQRPGPVEELPLVDDPGRATLWQHVAFLVTIHAARKAVSRYRAGRVPVAKTAGLAPKTVKNVHRMIHRAFADAAARRECDRCRSWYFLRRA